MKSVRNKIYFASDFHLGIPDAKESRVRERLLVSWLEQVRGDAAVIYLMGDLFDFWFEYRLVVPKGYARLFGKLAEITDSGTEMHLFRGNHDLWAFGYLEEEIGIKLHRKPQITTLLGKKFFLSHGDGLGPGDHTYKFMKSVFESRLHQFLYGWVHPDLGLKIGAFFSRRSRLTKMLSEGQKFDRLNPLENEPVVIFSRQMAASDSSIDYFVYGHVHFPDMLPVSEKAKCVILGDWVTHFSYGVFDGESLEIRYFIAPDSKQNDN